jgi:CheY-like chemotaxis protein
MTAILVIAMFVGFVALDLLVRHWTARRAQARARVERERILQDAVRLESTDEAKSLRRAEVPSPAARILAVDDEAVILDSFRKILVLEGYSVDTVESGPEALGLVQKRDYDFVFTDLKMPGMDGVEVVKAVKHLRPDIDVAVITGYGTIESAVETMQHGAVDYVQKPFTEDELTAFVRKIVVKREARLEILRKPSVRITTPDLADAAAAHEYCVPGGVFLSNGHLWVRIEPSGHVRIGIDDFARKALGEIDAVSLPEKGASYDPGQALFSVARSGQSAQFAAPLTGKVLQTNETLARRPAEIVENPYGNGWICMLEPRDLNAELKALRIGLPVLAWYQDEITRLQTTLSKTLPVENIAVLQQAFLK